MVDTDGAAAILASVLADPVSCQSTMLDTASIKQTAMDLLAEIGVDLDAEPYSTAHTAGNIPGIVVTAKEVLSTK